MRSLTLSIVAVLVTALPPAAAEPRAPVACPEISADARRIVSLTPAVTETLIAIGAADRLVAVSDFCEPPQGGPPLPKVGTALTPSYERIARLDPQLIVAEHSDLGRERTLTSVAPTCFLPWLSLPEVVAGIRRVGQLAGRATEADELADRMAQRLSATPPADAPRVLLVLAAEAQRTDEVWFVRRNSIHGAALHAAGGRNAIDRDVTGEPHITIERLLEIDPDVILILSTAKREDDAAVREHLARWQQLRPLRAVRDGRLAAVAAPESYIPGPRVLDLADRLRVKLAEIWQTQR